MVTAPEAVENLVATFLASDSLSISWTEPTYPNGAITSYEVTVTQTDDSNVVIYNNDSITDTTVTASVNVLPFTDYTVTVAASTSAGQGADSSITVTSPQAGIYTYTQSVAVIVHCKPFQLHFYIEFFSTPSHLL